MSTVPQMAADLASLRPWEWDVKRLAASLVLSGREVGQSDGKRWEEKVCFT